MTDYSLDIAFDWHSKIEGGFDGYLSVGWVQQTEGGPSFGSAYRLEAGKNTQIVFYDITEGEDYGKSRPSLQIPGGEPWLTIKEADVGSPIPPPQVPPGLRLGPREMRDSPHFGKRWSWAVMKESGIWEATLSLGRFLYTVRLDLKMDGQSKVFGVDPEMIVGGGQ